MRIYNALISLGCTFVLGAPTADIHESVSKTNSSSSGRTTSRYIPPPVTLTRPSPPAESSAGTTQAHSSTTAVSTAHKPLMMTYYPDWIAASMSPEDIDFTRFDWVDFAFGIPDKDFNITWDDPSADGSPELLRRLVQAGHAAGKKIKLSVGGWGGSRYMSDAVATHSSRLVFNENIVNLYYQYDLDGIDLDWEYPGQQGNVGNEEEPSDTPNFLSFIQLLRASLPINARITAAVQNQPFAGTDGKVMSDVSDFAKVLDWVVLMNYDVNSSSDTPGSNAPLSDGCHNATNPTGHAVAAFKTWTAAGFPASQLVLGIPSYGYVSRSNATNLYERSTGDDTKPLEVTNSDSGSANSGQVQFRDLVKQGALIRNSTSGNDTQPSYFAGGGFTRFWDKCSSTPFLRSPAVHQVITYDDPESLGMKAEFARRVGMLGVNMFDVHGDSVQWDLTDSARRNLGLD